MRRLIRSFFLACVILVLANCNLGGGPMPTPAASRPSASLPTATPTLDPQAIAAGISEATAATKTVHFAVTLSGKAVYSDPSQRFTMLSMEGDLQRPDAVLAALKVRGSGSLITVRTVSLAGKQFVTNPVNRQWLCAAPGDIFDPVVLFDPKGGVEQLISHRFEQVSLVGVDELDGRPQFHLRGTFPAEALRAISYNSLGAGVVAADVWADQETLRATQLVLVDSATDTANPSRWKLVFSDYDKAVDVRAPVQC